MSQLVAEFQVATPQTTDSSRVARVVMTPNLLGLQWNQVLLYPAGYAARDIQVRASVQLPAGWKHASACRLLTRARATTLITRSFPPCRWSTWWTRRCTPDGCMRQIDLTPAGGKPVRLNVFAEDEADLAATEEQVGIHRALVRETGQPSGRHAMRTTISWWCSATTSAALDWSTSNPARTRWTPGISSPGATTWIRATCWRTNTRTRGTASTVRPARLWTPHYNTPMQNDLLWVYEGMTQYYGMVLAARSGLWPQDFAREEFALTAAVFAGKRPGRSWRSLEDTTVPAHHCRAPAAVVGELAAHRGLLHRKARCCGWTSTRGCVN